jgi:hypothetical protein
MATFENKNLAVTGVRNSSNQNTRGSAIVIPKIQSTSQKKIGSGNNIIQNDNTLLNNFVSLISLSSPIIVPFGIILFSAFNNNSQTKDLICCTIYIFTLLFWVLIRLSLLNYLLPLPLSNKNTLISNDLCNKLSKITKKDTGTISTFIIAFTSTYIIGPMILNKSVNYYLLFLFLIYLIFDMFFKKTFCNFNITSISGDLLSGILLASLTLVIIISLGGSKLLFNNDVKNNGTVCSRPSSQQFKCNVYKNGELVQSSTAKSS